MSDLAAIEERVGDAAVVVSGVVTHRSAGAEALYGYALEEAVGRPLHELMIAPKDRSTCERIRDGVDETGTWESEFWVRRKDGTRLLHTSTIRPLRTISDTGSRSSVSPDEVPT